MKSLLQEVELGIIDKTFDWVGGKIKTYADSQAAERDRRNKVIEDKEKAGLRGGDIPKAPTEPKKPETREERGLGAQPMSDINAPSSTPPKDWKAKAIETATKLGKDAKENIIAHPAIAAGAAGAAALSGLGYLAYKHHKAKKAVK